MAPLATDLEAQANLDLTDLFGSLASDVLGVDLGAVTFDASGVLDLVAGAEGPDLDALRSTVAAVLAAGGERLDLGIPGVRVPPALLELTDRLGSLETLVPDATVPDLVGLDGLGGRLEAVRGAVESGPLADLLELAPALEWPGLLGRLGGDLGGLVELLRVLAALTATAATSRHLVERTERFAGLLDGAAAESAADGVRLLAGDPGLVAALGAADPSDAAALAELVPRVAAFGDAVLVMGETWSAGMGYGEATLPFVDVAGTAAAIEVARVALDGADLDAVAGLVAEIRRAGAVFLDAPLPDPASFAGGLVTRVAELATELTAVVEGWDVAGTLDPVTDLASLALRPITELQRALAAVESEVTGALQGLRGLVGELDLAPLTGAIDSALRPVTEVLDGVATEVVAAEATLEEVATTITTALDQVAGFVQDAATHVTGALEAVGGALEALPLQELGDTLSDELRKVADALGSAQLSPYFDAAIDVIDTIAEVVDAVPFGLLPTDVQQEIVDACQPIKELRLEPIENELRSELAQVRSDFQADALAAVEAAYADVLDVLRSLDPAPLLADFEAETMGQLQEQLDAIDPVALLAPVEEALGELRSLLAGLDLQAEVMEPLRELFRPVLEAVDALDPAALLAPVQEQVDDAREALSGLVPLGPAEEALRALRARAADALVRIDAAAVARALDARAVAALAELPEGPPGGAAGAALVSLAEASGFRADEPAVADVIGWIRGDAVGGEVVRARLRLAGEHVTSVRDTVAGLDPSPAVAAAAAHHRALRDAVAGHPDDSPLRAAVDPILAAASPAQVLGGLAENQRRYRVGLEAEAALVGGLGASGRSEVTETAGALRVALGPLSAFPARLRALLEALGLEPGSRPLREVLLDLLRSPGGLTTALTTLVDAVRDKAVEALDVAADAALETLGSVEEVLAVLDLAPIVAEVTALHAQVRDEIAALTPQELLGDAVAGAEEVVSRLEEFDPLAAVRDVLVGAVEAAEQVFSSARPTVVFAPAVDLHGDVMRIVGGLEVVSLLRPVLDALDAIGAQLDTGLDRTGDALTGLQAALPGEVTSTDTGASVDIGESL